jgi:pyrroline-5-carboxylate reductase
MEKYIMGTKVGFIGTGNMGTALLKGLIRSGAANPGDIYIFDADRSKGETLEKETGIRLAADNVELVRECDYIVLAVKPVYVGQVLEEIKEAFTETKVLISIAAGVTSKTLRAALGSNRKIIRTMPNLPALVGEGMTLMCFDNNIDESERLFVKRLFEGSGRAEELDEKFMSEVIALTSSSPAYIFMLIEAMGDGAVQSGIPRKIAYRLAAQAVLGSAKMVLETGIHPAELKDQVCSPAGTTIEAVLSLEKSGFRSSIMEAMKECTRKAIDIGRSSEGR